MAGKDAKDVTPPKPQTGMTTRQEFGAMEMESSAETAGTALAAQARAMVEARFIMAMRRPRDWDDVRGRLLKACERPGFAGSATEKIWGAAWYNKPVGDGVEGFSIRFAEEAVRAMGNIDVQTVTVYDDDRKRLLTVTVTDLEDNNSYPTSITISKTVERKYLKDGELALSVRTNSKGKATYTCEATEDEVFQKQQNLVSRAIRNGVMRLLPGDIQAECRMRILEIRDGDIAKNPDGVRKEVADAFSALNVVPSALKEYLGHDLSTSTPAELQALRDLYKVIKSGHVTWNEVLTSVKAERGEDVVDVTTGEVTEQPKKGLEAVTARLKGKAPTVPPVAPQTAPAPAVEAVPAKVATATPPPPQNPPPATRTPAAAPDPEPKPGIAPEDSDVAGLFDFDEGK